MANAGLPCRSAHPDFEDTRRTANSGIGWQSDQGDTIGQVAEGLPVRNLERQEFGLRLRDGHRGMSIEDGPQQVGAGTKHADDQERLRPRLAHWRYTVLSHGIRQPARS